MKKRKDIIIAITETAIFVALAIVFELLSKIIGLNFSIPLLYYLFI